MGNQFLKTIKRKFNSLIGTSRGTVAGTSKDTVAGTSRGTVAGTSKDTVPDISGDPSIKEIEDWILPLLYKIQVAVNEEAAMNAQKEDDGH